jgi:signal transduction histidine kinase
VTASPPTTVVTRAADRVEAAGYRTLLTVARAALLAFCGALVAVSAAPAEALPGLLGLAGLSMAATVRPSRATVRRAQPPAEGVLAALLVSSGQGLLTPLVPYLLAPPLAAGLLYGARWALITVALAAVSSLAVHALGVAAGPGGSGASLGAYLSEASQWTLTMLAVGLLAAWVRRVSAREQPATGENVSYEAAYRLISQLRVVARQLSRGLDTVTLAQSLLQSLRQAVGFDRGALYVSSPGGVLVALATEGGSRLDWPTSTDPDGLLGEAWATEQPRQREGGFDGSPGRWSAALPLRIGVRTFGIVGLEDDTGPFDWPRLGAAMTLVEEGALRLETALLFEEVRSIATAEERRRLAREIHDGIAQQLASLGYLVDDLTARATSLPDVAEDLGHLREELTRTITELRLSIFDLRSDVAPTVGLGTALSDYVRQVGAASAFTVHLVLEESPQRLRVETETELLRIAQEAITNARKHAAARNLWVTAQVEPPAALLRIEDDGVGLGPGREDSFGLEIMRERAARIGGRLSVQDRPEGGTLVEVTVGSPR